MGGRSSEIGNNGQRVGRKKKDTAATVACFLAIAAGGGGIIYGDTKAIIEGITDGIANSATPTPQRLSSELSGTIKPVSNEIPIQSDVEKGLLLNLGLITAGEAAIITGVVFLRRRRNAVSQNPPAKKS